MFISQFLKYKRISYEYLFKKFKRFGMSENFQTPKHQNPGNIEHLPFQSSSKHGELSFIKGKSFFFKSDLNQTIHSNFEIHENKTANSFDEAKNASTYNQSLNLKTYSPKFISDSPSIFNSSLGNGTNDSSLFLSKSLTIDFNFKKSYKDLENTTNIQRKHFSPQPSRSKAGGKSSLIYSGFRPKFGDQETHFILIETENLEEAVSIVENDIQKLQINGYTGLLSIKIKFEKQSPYFLELKNALFNLINDYGYFPFMNEKHPTSINCQISSFLTDEKEMKVIELPIDNDKELEQLIEKNVNDDKRLLVCFLPNKNLNNMFKKHTFAQKVIDICSKFGCQSDLLDRDAPLIQCETKNALAKSEIIYLPVLNPDRAEREIKAMLCSGFIGTVIFQPEIKADDRNTIPTYHKTLMANYPQKIVEICEKFGFNAAITDLKRQIVKCQMVEVKNSSLSQKDLDKIIVDGLAWAKNRRNEEPS